MYESYRLVVPGKFRDGVAFLDLETRHVPIPGGHVMANGELLRNRMATFMAGIGLDGAIVIVSEDSEGGELGVLTGIREVLGVPRPDFIAYASSKGHFDEMVLKGRYTYARRSAEPRPFYPDMDGAYLENWVNVFPAVRAAKRADPGFRAPDIKSAEASAALTDGRYELLMVHNLRDVAELILCAGEPDADCADWCLRVLKDTEFALNEIFGPEPEL